MKIYLESEIETDGEYCGNCTKLDCDLDCDIFENSYSVINHKNKRGADCLAAEKHSKIIALKLELAENAFKFVDNILGFEIDKYYLDEMYKNVNQIKELESEK